MVHHQLSEVLDPEKSPGVLLKKRDERTRAMYGRVHASEEGNKMELDKPSSFFFVNKTGSSIVLTRSKSEEKRRMLSHVQQQRRKREEEVGLTLSPQRIFSPESKNEDETSKRADEATATCSEVAPTPSPSSSGRLPGSYPSHNGWDPFYCTVGGIDASFLPMLHYTFSHFAKSAFLYEAFAPPDVVQRSTHMRHSQMMAQRLRRCVHDEMLMYSTLAYGSSSMAWSLGRIEEGKTPEYFIFRATRLVRARLSSARLTVDPWLLLSIYSLAISEMWNGSPGMWLRCSRRHRTALGLAEQSRRASRIHLRALASIVERTRGGWDGVDPYILESAILCDKFLAILCMTRPVLPLGWDPGPLPEPAPVPARRTHRPRSDDGLGRLGQAFRRIELRSELAGLMQDIADYVRAAQGQWESNANVARKVESHMFLRVQALNCRLLLMDNLVGIEECVRLAALLFLQNVIEFKGNRFSAMLLLGRLRAAMSNVEPCTEPGTIGLWFWCLCTGAMTPDHTEERDWFLREVAALSHAWPVVPGDYSAFQETIESFLFVHSKQKDQLADLVRNVSLLGELAVSST